MNLFVLTIMTILGHTVDFPNCFSSEVNPKLHAKIITDSAFFAGNNRKRGKALPVVEFTRNC